jgi:rhodanese-related sulfurtransferase
MIATSEMTMAEVLATYPGAQRTLFRLYHIGGCASCGFRPEETLAEVCARNEGIDPEEALARVQAGWEEDRKMLIEPTEARDHFAAGEADILDLRTAEEFEAVHIPGAQHFTQNLMQDLMGSRPKDRLLILVDHNGARSLDAAAYFSGHGLTNVKGLRGGIDAWSVEVDPSLPRYTLE